MRTAFLTVSREWFVPEDVQRSSYADTPLPIGHGQTISAPSMIAIMLEEAELSPGLDVLEVGTGSGYHAALIASIVGPERVVSVERVPELASWGRQNLRRAGLPVEVVVGDGTKGYPARAPYDRIVATAGAPRLPRPWAEQLRPGGLIVAPVGPSTFSQVLVTARKRADGTLDVREGTPCAFVPLIGEEGWRG